MVLEPILGSANRERVLIFLQAREEGYAREIARFFETDLFPIQDQLSYKYYEELDETMWSAHEVDYEADKNDYRNLILDR